MELKLEPIAEDERGASWRILLPDDREALLIFTRAGYFRGGHSHSKPEVSLLLAGKVKSWKMVNGEANAPQEYVAEKTAGEFMSNRAGEPHLTLALTDYWLLDWKIEARIGEWVSTEYAPYQVNKHQRGCPSCRKTFPGPEMIYDIDPFRYETAGSVDKVWQCRSCYEASRTQAHHAWEMRLGA